MDYGDFIPQKELDFDDVVAKAAQRSFGIRWAHFLI